MLRNRSLVGLVTLCLACAGGDESASRVDSGSDPAEAAPGVVTITARGLTFEAPEEIPAGWTTFRFVNESPMVHFAVIERMSEGHGVQEQQELVAPIFQEGMDLLAAGDVDGAMAAFGNLPPWFGEIVFVGGPGLTAPGRSSEATIYLEPGAYLIECYVKTAGIFHSYNPDPGVYGMVRELTVSEEMSDAVEPAADVTVTLSSAEGLVLDGAPAPGPQTFRVEFADQTVHENFVGHDIHLFRLSDDLDLGTVDAWMDWTRPGGLETPAPVVFVGGLNEMPAGETGYFTVTLEPGDYALISEVTGAMGKGLFKAFTVDSAAQ